MIKVLVFNGKKQFARINFKSLADFNSSNQELIWLFSSIEEVLRKEDELQKALERKTSEIIEYLDQFPQTRINELAKKFEISREEVFKIINLRNYIKNRIKEMEDGKKS
jgi:ABC-type Fe3+-citrate transport system substrate-binding protein